MSMFEANKVVAALLTAAVVAMGSGFVANLIFAHHGDEEHAYQIAVISDDAESADGEGEAGAAESGPPLATLLQSADAGAGESVAKKCKACHTFEAGGPNRIGPNLHGVVGQNVANHPDFSYSDALQAKSGEAWSYENLDAFLAAPKKWAPGTKMSFAGIKNAEDRADLLAYLRQVTPNPPPLPQ